MRLWQENAHIERNPIPLDHLALRQQQGVFDPLEIAKNPTKTKKNLKK
jgi:hypothetical protein